MMQHFIKNSDKATLCEPNCGLSPLYVGLPLISRLSSFFYLLQQNLTSRFGRLLPRAVITIHQRQGALVLSQFASDCETSVSLRLISNPSLQL